MSRKWYEENRERAKASSSEWAKANPEKRREIVKRNNAKRRQKVLEWNQLKNFGTVVKKECCALCGTTDGGPKGLVVHHEDGCNGNGVPLNNDPSNLVVLCRHCHPKVHGRGGLKRLSEVRDSP